jgi:hypothetical protein
MPTPCDCVAPGGATATLMLPYVIDADSPCCGADALCRLATLVDTLLDALDVSLARIETPDAAQISLSVDPPGATTTFVTTAIAIPPSVGFGVIDMNTIEFDNNSNMANLSNDSEGLHLPMSPTKQRIYATSAYSHVRTTSATTNNNLEIQRQVGIPSTGFTEIARDAGEDFGSNTSNEFAPATHYKVEVSSPGTTDARIVLTVGNSTNPATINVSNTPRIAAWWIADNL